MLFAGVDAHKATSQVTVVNSGGQILKRQRIPTSPEGFRKALSGFDQPVKAVLEASYSWGPTFDWLDDLCAEVVLAHPGKVRVIYVLGVTGRPTSAGLGKTAAETCATGLPSDQGTRCRHEWRHGTQECVRHKSKSRRSGGVESHTVFRPHKTVTFVGV